ncbi:MAG: hypothetical protein IKY65_04520 [Rikenellaceae bacterium]|nr:hypothetical protein [Rikenellaceae bacterium]
MEKRKIIFGTYDTASHGWTLTGWKLSAAEAKTKYIEKPNGDGSWDLSTALSDGIVRYKDRKLTASFECSEGTRMEREATIRDMINSLDGLRMGITLPDDPHHHVVGRLSVAREYNDLAHAAVSVAAVCEPWKYANDETVVTATASATKQRMELYNGGRRALVPTIEVTGDSVLLEYGTASMAMSAGTYRWPNLLLTPGGHSLVYSGAGTVSFVFREAVLE